MKKETGIVDTALRLREQLQNDQTAAIPRVKVQTWLVALEDIINVYTKRTPRDVGKEKEE
jgi:2-methylcitrate dehydratase PrpD